MARIAGVEIPNDKKLWVSLMSIYGMGEVLTKKVVESTKIDPNKLVKDLTKAELDMVRGYIDANFEVEGELRQNIFRNIKRLKAYFEKTATGKIVI